MLHYISVKSRIEVLNKCILWFLIPANVKKNPTYQKKLKNIRIKPQILEKVSLL